MSCKPLREEQVPAGPIDVRDRRVHESVEGVESIEPGLPVYATDRNRHRLEDLVDGFLESLGMASLDEKERERERIRQHQEWEAAEKRRIEEQRRREEEQKRVQELLSQVATFNEAARSGSSSQRWNREGSRRALQSQPGLRSGIGLNGP